MYYVIDKRNDELVLKVPMARNVITYLLGRTLRHYIIIKSSGIDQVYVPNTNDVFQIEKELEAL